MSHTDPHAARRPLQNPAVGHEHDDVDIKALTAFAVGLLAVIAIVYVLMWGLFKVLDRQAARNDPPQSPLTRPAVAMPPTTVGNPYFGPGEGPQLLISEPTVLRRHRQTEADALGTYGWVNEKAGVARIPIAEAKKLILQRGLPARADGSADASLGTRRAAFGESSSGREIGRKQEDAAPQAPAAPAPAQPAAPHKGHEQ